MTALGHAELPTFSTPRYGTSLIGLPAAVLLAGLVMLGIRGCRLGVEPEPVPAFGSAGHYLQDDTVASTRAAISRARSSSAASV